MEEPAFQADEGIDVQLSPDGSLVRLDFLAADGRKQSVQLKRSDLPILLSVLASKIEPGTLTPISRVGDLLGKSVSLDSFDLEHRSDGHKRLTFFVTREGDRRTVAIPLDLSPDEIRGLVEMLRK